MSWPVAEEGDDGSTSRLKDPQWAVGGEGNTLRETKTEAKKTPNKGRQKRPENKQNKTKPTKVVT